MQLQVACDGERLPDEAFAQGWCEAALAAAGRTPGHETEIAVRLVDEAESRALNRRYRDRDRPTNVLSFPAADDLPLPDDDALPLGDLVLCAPVVLREAAEQGKDADAHWAHLLVHGTLHLLGYDHAEAVGAAEMEALETAILAARGLPDPYAARETG